MDESKVERGNGPKFAGAVVEERRLSGALISRVMHPPRQCIGSHSHDWPALILCRVGGYRETAAEGSATFDGPGVILQPPHAGHADEIGANGLETLTMSFDPDWLAADARAALPNAIAFRPGGVIAAAAQALARTWLDAGASDTKVREDTSRFLLAAHADEGPSAPPPWIERLLETLDAEASTARAAETLSLNPAWVARAYRAWRGEGIAETLRRRRVERAILLLRYGEESLAGIAAATGFCDQSHMNRSFRAVLGRTPLEVRLEASLLAPFRKE